MSRSNRLPALLLCLLLLCTSAAAESVNLIPEDRIVSNSVNYETLFVSNGTYERTYSIAAESFYPYTYNLRFDGKNMKFDKCTVKRGEMVKKGDVLALFYSDSDRVELTTQQLLLERTQLAMETQVLAMEKEIKEMQESLLTTRDRFESELLRLRIERAELALEQYIYQQEAQIASIEKSIAKIQEELSNTALVSPVDGLIVRTIIRESGDTVAPDEVVVTIYRTDCMMLAVDNEMGYLRYGMNVQVEYGSNKSRMSVNGQVVGSDAGVPASQRKNLAYVRVERQMSDTELINPKVIAAGVSLDNVIVVPRKILTLEKGNYYVMKLIDGIACKRFVNCMPNNNQDVWVLQGLEPGEEIIID